MPRDVTVVTSPSVRGSAVGGARLAAGGDHDANQSSRTQLAGNHLSSARSGAPPPTHGWVDLNAAICASTQHRVVVSLSFASCVLSAGQWDWFAFEALPSLHSIRRIDLSDTEFTDERCVELLRGLKCVWDDALLSRLGKDGVDRFFGELNLSRNNLTSASAHLLGQFISRPQSSGHVLLKALDISCNRGIGDHGLQVIASHIKTGQLRVFNAASMGAQNNDGGQRCSIRGVVDVLVGVSCSSTIEDLYMFGLATQYGQSAQRNRVVPFPRSIFDSFRCNTILRTIDLSQCGLAAECVKELVPVIIVRCPGLRALLFSRNYGVGDAVCAAICAMIDVWTRDREARGSGGVHARLNSNASSPHQRARSQMRRITARFPSGPLAELELLALDGTQLSDEGLQLLADAFEVMSIEADTVPETVDPMRMDGPVLALPLATLAQLSLADNPDVTFDGARALISSLRQLITAVSHCDEQRPPVQCVMRRCTGLVAPNDGAATARLDSVAKSPYGLSRVVPASPSAYEALNVIGDGAVDVVLWPHRDDVSNTRRRRGTNDAPSPPSRRVDAATLDQRRKAYNDRMIVISTSNESNSFSGARRWLAAPVASPPQLRDATTATDGDLVDDVAAASPVDRRFSSRHRRHRSLGTSVSPPTSDVVRDFDDTGYRSDADSSIAAHDVSDGEDLRVAQPQRSVRVVSVVSNDVHDVPRPPDENHFHDQGILPAHDEPGAMHMTEDQAEKFRVLRLQIATASPRDKPRWATQHPIGDEMFYTAAAMSTPPADSVAPTPQPPPLTIAQPQVEWNLLGDANDAERLPPQESSAKESKLTDEVIAASTQANEEATSTAAHDHSVFQVVHVIRGNDVTHDGERSVATVSDVMHTPNRDGDDVASLGPPLSDAPQPPPAAGTPIVAFDLAVPPDPRQVDTTWSSVDVSPIAKVVVNAAESVPHDVQQPTDGVPPSAQSGEVRSAAAMTIAAVALFPQPEVASEVITKAPVETNPVAAATPPSTVAPPIASDATASTTNGVRCEGPQLAPANSGVASLPHTTSAAPDSRPATEDRLAVGSLLPTPFVDWSLLAIPAAPRAPVDPPPKLARPQKLIWRHRPGHVVCKVMHLGLRNLYDALKFDLLELFLRSALGDVSDAATPSSAATSLPFISVIDVRLLDVNDGTVMMTVLSNALRRTLERALTPEFESKWAEKMATHANSLAARTTLASSDPDEDTWFPFRRLYILWEHCRAQQKTAEAAKLPLMWDLYSVFIRHELARRTNGATTLAAAVESFHGHHVDAEIVASQIFWSTNRSDRIDDDDAARSSPRAAAVAPSGDHTSPPPVRAANATEPPVSIVPGPNEPASPIVSVQRIHEAVFARWSIRNAPVGVADDVSQFGVPAFIDNQADDDRPRTDPSAKSVEQTARPPQTDQVTVPGPRLKLRLGGQQAPSVSDGPRVGESPAATSDSLAQANHTASVGPLPSAATAEGVVPDFKKNEAAEAAVGSLDAPVASPTSSTAAPALAPAPLNATNSTTLTSTAPSPPAAAPQATEPARINTVAPSATAGGPRSLWDKVDALEVSMSVPQLTPSRSGADAAHSGSGTVAPRAPNGSFTDALSSRRKQSGVPDGAARSRSESVSSVGSVLAVSTAFTPATPLRGTSGATQQREVLSAAAASAPVVTPYSLTLRALSLWHTSMVLERQGDMTLPPESRNKLSICKGVATFSVRTTACGCDPNAAKSIAGKNVGVTVSVEWRDFLVVKKKSLVGVKDLLIVHPLIVAPSGDRNEIAIPGGPGEIVLVLRRRATAGVPPNGFTDLGSALHDSIVETLTIKIASDNQERAVQDALRAIVEAERESAKITTIYRAVPK